MTPTIDEAKRLNVCARREAFQCNVDCIICCQLAIPERARDKHSDFDLRLPRIKRFIHRCFEITDAVGAHAYLLGRGRIARKAFQPCDI